MDDFLANADMVSGEMQQKNVKVKEHFHWQVLIEQFFSMKILMVLLLFFFFFFFSFFFVQNESFFACFGHKRDLRGEK